MRLRQFFNRHYPVISALLIALVLSGVVDLFERIETDRLYQQRQARAVAQLSTIRARLEGIINSTLFLSRGLVSYVSSHGGISRREFDRMGRELLHRNPYIRNIGLAEGRVVKYVYPLKGNEAAVGLHYMDIPDQREAVERAIRSRRTVVAGPVDLVQGGRGFISRTPVFLSPLGKPPDSGKFWGLVSIVINQTPLFQDAGLLRANSKLKIAIRGRDGLGADGAVFFGDPALFARSPLKMAVTLPEGAWQMAAVPAGGWHATGAYILWLRVIGFFLVAVVSGLVYATLARQKIINHMALHDNLTDLPNRRLFDDRLEQAIARARRSGGHFAVVQVDLDNFKPVNDTYGHKAGDAVLVAVGHRLRSTLREVDTVSRFGGDEFAVVLADVRTREDAEATVEKLRGIFDTPLPIGQHLVNIAGSVGYALYPDDADSGNGLLASADDAMYAEKARHKGAIG